MSKHFKWITRVGVLCALGVSIATYCRLSPAEPDNSVHVGDCLYEKYGYRIQKVVAVGTNSILIKNIYGTIDVVTATTYGSRLTKADCFTIQFKDAE